MAVITVFGTGGLGGAVASVLSAGGHEVQAINTATEKAPLRGDVVVLAVPHPAVAGVVEEYRDELAGKIVVDPTNPVDFATFDRLVVPADSSAAAELVEALPESRVVKALNTNFSPTLTAGAIGGTTPTVLLAGDDTDAKEQVAAILAAGGAVTTLDVGSLKLARELEAVGFLQLQLALAGKVPFTGGFAVIR